MQMTPEMALGMRDFFVGSQEKEIAALMGVVRAMPDDKLGYKPESRLMGFGLLALHVAGSGNFFTEMIEKGKVDMAGPPPDPAVPATTAELAQQCAELFKTSSQAYRDFSGEQLAREIDFFGLGKNPAVLFINFDVSHLIHHRSQMALYLRIAGEKVPSIYGPTLDVSFEDLTSGA